MPSLAYGLPISDFGAVILGFWRHPYLVAASISGFLLVGPVFTTGLREPSRRRVRGASMDFDGSLSALGCHRRALSRFAAELLIIPTIWLAMSTLMLHLALGSAGPSIQGTVWGGALDQVTSAQAVGYLVIGGILACVVFARSVVSVPLIIDRDVDAQMAVRRSLRVTWQDFPAKAIWAVLIVLLVAFGLGTFLLGIIVVFPLLGRATWHAYDDLVRSNR